MTGATCGDRHNGDPHRLQTLSIQLGGHIALKHSHGQLLSQQGQRSLEQSCFARTWAAHHIERKQLPDIKIRTVVFSMMLVCSQQIHTKTVF